MTPHLFALLAAVALLIVGGLLAMTGALPLEALGTLFWVVGALLLTLLILVVLVAGVRRLLTHHRHDAPTHQKRRGHT